MTKPRCGAPLPANKDPRRKYDTCRHIVQEGKRCHRHQVDTEALEQKLERERQWDLEESR